MEVGTNMGGLEAQGAEPNPATQDPSQPQSQELNEATLVSEVYRKYDLRRMMRRPYEIQWYLNASALRGFPDVRFNAELNRLEIKREPAHRKRMRINLIKPKYVTRVAKYTRATPTPVVVPATTDREDIFNARASQKALEYATQKMALRSKFMQLMQWVPVTGKAFLWLRWDEEALGRTMMEGQVEPILGEVTADFGSAFEFLPADPGIETVADQPEIMRVKMVPVADIEEKYPHLKGLIPAESNEADLFFYQRQIADLGTRQQGMASRATQQMEDTPSYVLRIEMFTKPCGKYPAGRYVVCAGHKLLRYEGTLPGGFQNITRNPYPVVEFQDDAAPGQFWPDAFIERLIGLQSEFNLYRSMMAENMALHMFPKLMIPKQANLAPDAYTSEAGEKIEYTWINGMPPLGFLQPQGVLGDVWNLLNEIKREMDDVTMIYPASIGGTGGATSGTQTNLLQEAADQVHGPAIQRNAYALQEMYMKIRHLMKEYYDVPRLVTIAGRNNLPEVTELSRESIDENADIVVEPDTMMPMLRSARIEMYRGMYKDGLYGDPADPKTRKRVMDQIRMGWAEFDTDREQRDEEQAQLENIKMTRGEPLAKPQVWENHEIHWEAHTDLFKSSEVEGWSEEQFKANVWHALVHLMYINPTQAMMMAGEYGLQQQLAQLIMMQNQFQQQAFMVAPPPQQGPAPQA